MTTFPIEWVRDQFPSLRLSVAGHQAIFLDGPGGTQVPEAVIRAVSDYYRNSNSNLGGEFFTSRKTVEMVRQARIALAEFLNAPRPEEIIFGQNMTSLTFALSRALARTWESGAEVVVTSLDHDANITPWRLAAADREVTLKTWEVRKEGCKLEVEDLQRLVTERTKLIAVTLASNAAGTHVDVQEVCKLAQRFGAIVFVDAVHFAPHGRIDVQALGCDFLVCSAYKFFGPHIGVLWGRYPLLEKLGGYKVRPASDHPPGKWETGTQSFESIAGVTAALRYLRDLGNQANGDQGLANAMQTIQAYESELTTRFLRGLRLQSRITVYGIRDTACALQRTPTFAIRVEGVHPDVAALRLAEQGIFVWSGNLYAVDLINRLGLAEVGGVIRLGFAHYNTLEEVDETLEALMKL